MAVKEAKTGNPAGFVFWRYSQFPFVVGTVSTKSFGEGFYQIPAYGPSARIKAEYVTETFDGMDIMNKLDVLKGEHQAAINRVNAEYAQKALAIAPFLAKFPGYKKEVIKNDKS